jgi:hypothetical protein
VTAGGTDTRAGGPVVIIVDPVATQEACELTAADITWDLALADAPESAFDDVLVTAICEAQSYRLLAQQVLQQLHAVTLERDLLRSQRAIDRRREREEA